MKNVLACVVIFVSLSRGLEMERGTPNEEQELFQNNEIEKLVTFRLFTRENPRDGVILISGDKAKLISSGFKGSLPTIICSHGYFDNENSSWIKLTKQGVLRKEEVNFITLDYSAMSHNLLYDEVVNFTKDAGLYTGRFLKFLQIEGGFNVGRAHLIGHSLGAQVLGFAAKAFPVKKILGRITGICALDPAGPLFEHASESDRLNPDSAKVVDVIHTCTFFIGMKNPVGTIDFYPNGGYHQRGCKDFDLRCHHVRAREYFYETLSGIGHVQYEAKKCATLENAFNGTCYGESAIMGYYLNYSSPGIYYLKIE